MNLNAQQVVATAEDHQDIITEPPITHAKIIDIIAADWKYRKRDKNARGIHTVNQIISDAIISELGDTSEVPITSENEENHAPKEVNWRNCPLIWKHEHICSAKGVHIHATNHRIDLVPRMDRSSPHHIVLDRKKAI